MSDWLSDTVRYSRVGRWVCHVNECLCDMGLVQADGEVAGLVTCFAVIEGRGATAVDCDDRAGHE